MKKLLRIALISATSLGLVLAGAPGAAAATTSFDVTRLSAPNIVVKDDNCQRTTVTMAHTKRGIGYWDVDTDVRRAGSLKTSASIYSGGNTRTNRVLICPDIDGLGRYTLGPSDINADARNWQDRDVVRTDKTTGNFYVRAHAKGSVSSSRSGSRVTLNIAAQRYSPTNYGYRNYSPKATVQVQTATGWRTVSTVSLVNGRANVVLNQKSSRTYRVVVPATNTTTGFTRTVTR